MSPSGLFLLFFFSCAHGLTGIEQDNCAASAAGFPVYVATQLCVTCPVPPPTEIHVSSAAETLAVAIVATVAAVVVIVALFVCCFLYLWFLGATRRVREATAAPTNGGRRSFAPQGPRQYEFTFAQDGTAPGSYAAPVRQLPARHATQVEFAFAAPGAVPGATTYVMEPGPPEPPPLVTPVAPPGAPSVVEIRFAEPGQQAGATAELMPDPRPSSGADLFTLMPAAGARSFSKKRQEDEQQERRGRSRSPRAAVSTAPTRLRRRDVGAVPVPPVSQEEYVDALVETEAARGPALPLYHPRRGHTAAAGSAGALPLHLQ